MLHSARLCAALELLGAHQNSDGPDRAKQQDPHDNSEPEHADGNDKLYWFPEKDRRGPINTFSDEVCLWVEGHRFMRLDQRTGTHDRLDHAGAPVENCSTSDTGQGGQRAVLGNTHRGSH